MADLYIVGDVHGQYEKLVQLLTNAHLVTPALSWNAGKAHLWFIGDFFDRGPGSLLSVELAMRLQREAAAAGGVVNALLGNHEIMFLGAYRFRERSSAMVYESWLRNGGVVEDIQRITPEQVAWVSALPAMALVNDRLLMHADALLYASYGSTTLEVNRRITELLRSADESLWEYLMELFNERMAFAPSFPGSRERAIQMLRIFGGRQLIHGHTPIHYMLPRTTPQDVHSPLVYTDRLCVNVDGGMYLGGQGFIHHVAEGD